MMSSPVPAAKGPVCVTGATGYVGSWLVRSLLRRGYCVHATARDLGKARQMLLALEGSDRLNVFQADLDVEGSFDKAMEDCIGLFHVAAPLELVTSSAETVEDQVRSNILPQAVNGIINLLQACKRAGTVKRVVFTSSIANITAEDENGVRKSVVDESFIRSIDEVWKTKPSGWMYILIKQVTEDVASRFCQDEGIEIVSVILPTVAGPFLTPGVPISLRVLLCPLTGDVNYYQLFVSVYSRFRSLPLVHVEDACDSHILLMEKDAAEGRYFACNGSIGALELARLLSLQYPSYNPERLLKDLEPSNPSSISIKRLLALGYKFKNSVEDIIIQAMACCAEHGFFNS